MEPKKILVIEDDDFLRKLFMKKLGQFNFEVEQAADGEEGLRKVQEYRPDIVVLDMIMPIVDGFEVIKEIRSLEDEQLSKIPILAVSNLGQETEIQTALKLGANDYLIKAHFSTEEIVQKIKEQLNLA